MTVLCILSYTEQQSFFLCLQNLNSENLKITSMLEATVAMENKGK